MPKKRVSNKEWHREWMRKRRAAFFLDKFCVRCGSTERLELDHIIPEEKEHHSIWSWSEQRRNAELAKCQVLCHDCHKKKSVKECFDRGIYGMHRKRVIDGKVWCNKHQDFLPVENFNKDKYTASGYYAVCKECRRLYKNRLKSRRTWSTVPDRGVRHPTAKGHGRRLDEVLPRFEVQCSILSSAGGEVGLVVQ